MDLSKGAEHALYNVILKLEKIYAYYKTQDLNSTYVKAKLELCRSLMEDIRMYLEEAEE